MVRIAIVIPYASMANLAWDVFQEHTEQMRLQALDATEYSLDILVASTTQELLPQWPDCDAMIARGATYLDLCRRSLSIPVIELIINGTDIVNTLLQLRQKYGPVPAAILGTQNMILGVEKLARQLGVDVTPYCFQENSLLEIRRCVEQAARDGKRVIIGGGTGGGKPGLFEIAHNGTIFLDEISEIPLGLQGRLLRVLQEREIMRLGDSQVTPINIRVIAATNKNLESLVRAGKFRSDLYYRLYVLQLNLPPLRERQEDIPLLTQSFLRNFQAREGDGCPLELSDGDCRLLQSCPWRGNIRELQNFCERLAVLYRPGVSVSGLIAHLLESAASPETPPPCPPPMPKAAHTRIDLSYEELLAVLQECGGNRTQTAAKLGISRGTLWRLLKKYQVGQT